MPTNRPMLMALVWSAVSVALLLPFATLLTGPHLRPMIMASAMLMIVIAAWIARRVHRFPMLLAWGVAAVGIMYPVEAVTADVLMDRFGISVTDVIDLGATAAIICMTRVVGRRRRGGLTVGEFAELVASQRRTTSGDRCGSRGFYSDKRRCR